MANHRTPAGKRVAELAERIGKLSAPQVEEVERVLATLEGAPDHSAIHKRLERESGDKSPHSKGRR